MSVKTALALINQMLDEVLQEQDGNLDSDSRFCVKWYEQFGWDAKPYGESDVLARAVNVSVDGLVRGGVLTNAGSKVQLIRPADMNPAWDPETDDRTSVWEAVVQLCRVLESEGINAAAALMVKIKPRTDLDDVRGLAYRLYEIAQNGRTEDAIMFNNLATAWIDIKQSADKVPASRSTQGGFDFDALADQGDD
jgi:putative DNA methylase